MHTERRLFQVPRQLPINCVAAINLMSCQLLLFPLTQLTISHFPHNRARTATPSRTMAVESRAHLHKDIPKNWDQLKNNIWLSDAGAYPVLVVLTFACGMCGSYMAYTGMKNQDVRWSFSKRQQLIRTWE